MNNKTTLDTFSYLNTLKKERNAVILAHYYQNPDIQVFADFMGNSLTRPLLETDTAKILNPMKRMLALS